MNKINTINKRLLIVLAVALVLVVSSTFGGYQTAQANDMARSISAPTAGTAMAQPVANVAGKGEFVEYDLDNMTFDSEFVEYDLDNMTFNSEFAEYDLDNTTFNSEFAENDLDNTTFNDAYTEHDLDKDVFQLTGDQNDADAVAERGYGDIADIESFWNENGYPSYISYAFAMGAEKTSANEFVSHYAIGVVGDVSAHKDEILSLVGSNCAVTFVSCQYSNAERLEAMNEINAMGNEWILSASIARNSQFVDVQYVEGISDEIRAECNTALQARFGGMVKVVSVGGVNVEQINGGIGGDARTMGGNNSYGLFYAMFFVVLAIASVIMFMKSRQHGRVLALSNGETAMVGKVTTGEIKKAVKEEFDMPSTRVLNNIMNDINK